MNLDAIAGLIPEPVTLWINLANQHSDYCDVLVAKFADTLVVRLVCDPALADDPALMARLIQDEANYARAETEVRHEP